MRNIPKIKVIKGLHMAFGFICQPNSDINIQWKYKIIIKMSTMVHHSYTGAGHYRLLTNVYKICPGQLYRITLVDPSLQTINKKSLKVFPYCVSNTTTMLWTINNGRGSCKRQQRCFQDKNTKLDIIYNREPWNFAWK